eukprot:gene9478-19687_t
MIRSSYGAVGDAVLSSVRRSQSRIYLAGSLSRSSFCSQHKEINIPSPSDLSDFDEGLIQLNSKIAGEFTSIGISPQMTIDALRFKES